MDFVWPMPDKNELKTLYDREDWFEGGEKGGYQNYDVQTEASLMMVAEILDKFPQDSNVRYVMDVGCGYGSHLKSAADRGWKCFGVEPSEHARSVALQRHGGKIYLVEDVGDIIPHQFDLILMLDVIEHLSDPYMLMFNLFSKGAIGPDTLLVLTTPNARSTDALVNPKKWAYRHPPSHLLYFSGYALQLLLQRLRFSQIHIHGTSPLPLSKPQPYEDEQYSLNEQLYGYAGLLCEAHGSDFMQFMQERYVPGTWSKLAEYEHLPRYIFAKQFVADGRVLDFGCGTGYGSAILADIAASVLGLDIDAEAIGWAQQAHQNSRLVFECRNDAGKGLQKQTFDCVTCFEMIEHVDHETQMAVIQNISRLLTKEGLLIISTPNPEVTALYGENPYHVHEMTETEFKELLNLFFEHVVILRQWIRPSILIAKDAIPKTANFNHLPASNFYNRPVGFIAICSHSAVDKITGLCELDVSFDYVQFFLERENKANNLSFQNYTLIEKSQALEQTIQLLQSEIQFKDDKQRQIEEKNQGLEQTIQLLQSEMQLKDDKQKQIEELFKNVQNKLLHSETELQAIRQTRWFKLQYTILHERWGLKKIVLMAHLIGAMVTPSWLRNKLTLLKNRHKE